MLKTEMFGMPLKTRCANSFSSFRQSVFPAITSATFLSHLETETCGVGRRSFFCKQQPFAATTFLKFEENDVLAALLRFNCNFMRKRTLLKKRENNLTPVQNLWTWQVHRWAMTPTRRFVGAKLSIQGAMGEKARGSVPCF